MKNTGWHKKPRIRSSRLALPLDKVDLDTFIIKTKIKKTRGLFFMHQYPRFCIHFNKTKILNFEHTNNGKSFQHKSDSALLVGWVKITVFK